MYKTKSELLSSLVIQGVSNGGYHITAGPDGTGKPDMFNTLMGQDDELNTKIMAIGTVATQKAVEASASALSAANSANSANISAQASHTVAFTTVALMNSNLAYTANITALVTNDPTTINNGIYIKLGASGAGSWQKSAYVPIPLDNSIDPIKLSFLPIIGAIGKNLFNKLTVTTGQYVPWVHGVLNPNSAYSASDWIPVLPNTIYTIANRQQFALYNASKVYITGADVSGNVPYTLTTPATAAYIRISTLLVSLDTQQLELGSVSTSYESYKTIIPEGYITSKSFPDGIIPSDLINSNSYQLASISPEILNFPTVSLVIGKNLFNKETVISDRYIQNANGLVSIAGDGSGPYSASDWIPVLPNTVYTVSKGNQFAYYDSNKTYISGDAYNSNGIHSFTTPSNAYYIRISTYTINLDTQQLELGSASTAYESYGYIIPPSYIKDISPVVNYDQTTSRLITPPKMFFVSGEELPIYRDSIIPDNSRISDSSVVLTTVKVTGVPKRFDITSGGFFIKPDDIPGTTFDIGVKQIADQTASYYTTITKQSVNSTANTGKTPKIDMIGDSLTNRYLPAYLKTRLTDFGVNSTMLGTMANLGGQNGEGREGWTFANFIGASNMHPNGTVITLLTSGSTSTLYQNPFLKLATGTDIANHPTWCFRNTGVTNELSYATDTVKTGDFYIFDFANYLANHSILTPDVVTIALSTNDIWNMSAGASLASCRIGLQVMVKQIKTALPNVKIGVIPAPAWGSSAVGNTYWQNQVCTWIENCMTDIASYGLLGVDIVPIWSHTNRDWNWDFTNANLSSINISQKGTWGEYVHFNDHGRYEYVNALAQWAMNVI